MKQILFVVISLLSFSVWPDDGDMRSQRKAYLSALDKEIAGLKESAPPYLKQAYENLVDGYLNHRLSDFVHVYSYLDTELAKLRKSYQQWQASYFSLMDTFSKGELANYTAAEISNDILTKVSFLKREILRIINQHKLLHEEISNLEKAYSLNTSDQVIKHVASVLTAKEYFPPPVYKIHHDFKSINVLLHYSYTPGEAESSNVGSSMRYANFKAGLVSELAFTGLQHYYREYHREGEEGDGNAWIIELAKLLVGIGIEGRELRKLQDGVIDRSEAMRNVFVNELHKVDTGRTQVIKTLSDKMWNGSSMPEFDTRIASLVSLSKKTALELSEKSKSIDEHYKHFDDQLSLTLIEMANLREEDFTLILKYSKKYYQKAMLAYEQKSLDFIHELDQKNSQSKDSDDAVEEKFNKLRNIVQAEAELDALFLRGEVYAQPRQSPLDFNPQAENQHPYYSYWSIYQKKYMEDLLK